MASCNSWQYLVTILAKNFPRSWQDLGKILLRYPWRVDPGIEEKIKIVFTLSEQDLAILKRFTSYKNLKSCYLSDDFLAFSFVTISILVQRTRIWHRYSFFHKFVFQIVFLSTFQNLPYSTSVVQNITNRIDSTPKK